MLATPQPLLRKFTVRMSSTWRPCAITCPAPFTKNCWLPSRKDEKLDPDIANEVAQAMMTWALEKGAKPLHALVPASQWEHGGKARLLCGRGPGGKSGTQIFRQEPGAGRAGRLQLPFRRSPAPPLKRAATPHGTPPSPAFIKRTEKRRHALHPNRFLLLQGTGAGQKDASPEIHDCCHPAGQAAVVLLWRSGQPFTSAPTWGRNRNTSWWTSSFMPCART